MKKTIIIVGLGNELLRDDGVGIHAVRLLLNDPPPDSIVLEVGTAVLDALPLLREANLVIGLDAIATSSAPGTLLALAEEDAQCAERPASLHDVSLIEAVRFDRELREAPPHIVLIGVEPAIIDYGLDLSSAVATALPKLIQIVRDFVSHWQEHPGFEKESPREMLEAFHDARFILEPA